MFLGWVTQGFELFGFHRFLRLKTALKWWPQWIFELIWPVNLVNIKKILSLRHFCRNRPREHTNQVSGLLPVFRHRDLKFFMYCNYRQIAIFKKSYVGLGIIFFDAVSCIFSISTRSLRINYIFFGPQTPLWP